MIPWSTLQPGLVALTKRLTGLSNVRWSGAQASFVSAEDAFAEAELMAYAVTSKGMLDALTWAEASPDGPLLQTAHGMREMTLRTRVTVYDQRPELVARMYLERMRDRMAWDSTRDALTALNLGLITALALTDQSTPRDQHITSIAYLDLRLNVATSETDPTEYSRITSGEFALELDP